MASSRKKSSGRGNSQRRKSNSRAKSNKRQNQEVDFSWKTELVLYGVLTFSIISFLGILGTGGVIGGALGSFFFGMFGVMSYLFPFLLFFYVAFLMSNLYGRDRNLGVSVRLIVKAAAILILYLFLCVFAHIVSYGKTNSSPISLYNKSALMRNGGGLVGGVLGCALTRGFGIVGAVIIVLLVWCLCVAVISQRALFRDLSRGGKHVMARARQQRQNISERQPVKKAAEDKVKESAPSGRQKVRGVTFDTEIRKPKPQESDGDITEILPQPEKKTPRRGKNHPVQSMDDIVEIPVAQEEITDRQSDDFWEQYGQPNITMTNPEPEREVIPEPEEIVIQEETPRNKRVRQPKQQQEEVDTQILDIGQEILEKEELTEKEYVFPDINLLHKGDPNATGDSRKHLQEMSAKLQMTLTNFGVNARVTNVICGPTVTQYEIQPEMGVKVSKILNLADDIKLNLAVPDIRIEAPIPGKAAIGIEVPNKENVTVAFRDLVESREFKEHPSNIAFCAGKDIAGNVIVADIAKMPHVLIAGSTGSGKSVCINTIIMSILYRANPEDVKLIMIDPKVVELSVYNGIPHLLIPVVTDPKKAAGALHWAVAEMSDRYQKFAEYGVRDVKGYNKKVEIANEGIENGDKVKKMPQIVVIVDELADLMMVAPGDVEDAICRLAQLARAAGIHLIIATQRPSVNVITGLIKANMPSRVAFAVTSGVDSRTILDMNGAEKLLGKGDMLFYPQGYAKPLRVQGAFVTDKEVADVVSYIVEHNGEGAYSSDIEEKVKSSESSMGGGGGFAASDERDAYFRQAGEFIIEKEKGSIGMLQRMFKIGFNRAARIMDQLEEAGVVGPEEGTKPRKVLMTLSEFEQIADE